MCRDATSGTLFQGTVIDIRPRCGVCGDWHDTGAHPHESPTGMVSEPFGTGQRFVFIATPGWPHMHRVVDEYVRQRDGVWRGGSAPGLERAPRGTPEDPE